jgi:excisionase family DNA binding protein
MSTAWLSSIGWKPDEYKEVHQVAEERLLTVRDIVEMLQLSRSTVMALLAHGDIESLKIRRARRVTGTALRNFIQARATESAERHPRGARGVEAGSAEEVGVDSTHNSYRT